MNVTVSPMAAVIVCGFTGMVQVIAWFVPIGEGGGGELKLNIGGGGKGGGEGGGGDAIGGDGGGGDVRRPAGGEAVIAIFCPAPQ